jgi:hypothetical protein
VEVKALPADGESWSGVNTIPCTNRKYPDPQRQYRNKWTRKLQKKEGNIIFHSETQCTPTNIQLASNAASQPAWVRARHLATKLGKRPPDATSTTQPPAAKIEPSSRRRTRGGDAHRDRSSTTKAATGGDAGAGAGAGGNR